MKTLVEQIQSQDALSRFHLIPGRIFLDTNVLQYVQDFGEYIFDNYRESEDCFQSGKKTIRNGERLFNEIEALHDFFINVNRAHFEFASSEVIYREVLDKKDSHFLRWFQDVWDHWEAVVSEYEAGEVFSAEAEKHYQIALTDKSLSGSLSDKDREGELGR